MERVEKVGGGVEVWVSERHTFGTDSFLLSHFAAPRRHELTCDLGTGCGIIPLLWFREEPAPRQAFAVDIQREAVALLESSVERSGLSGRVIPMEADLREIGAGKGPDGLPVGQLHLVTCNPPYNAMGTGIPSERDSDLIARHEAMCTMEDVCRAADRLLRYGGRFCVCQLPERLVDVLAAMRQLRLEPKRLRMVQQRGTDAPWLVLVEGKKGGKPSLRVEPPLVMREDGDGPSPEMREIYRYYGKV